MALLLIFRDKFKSKSIIDDSTYDIETFELYPQTYELRLKQIKDELTKPFYKKHIFYVELNESIRKYKNPAEFLDKIEIKEITNSQYNKFKKLLNATRFGSVKILKTLDWLTTNQQ